MRKIIFLIPLVLAFFFTHPNLAHAEITAVQDPLPVCQDSKTLKFTFIADEKSSFITDRPYRLATYSPEYDYSTPRKPVSISAKELEFQITLYDSAAPIGGRSYVLWMGERTEEINSSTVLLRGNYYISPKDACTTGRIALRLDQQEFQAGTTAKLYLLNANPNSDYVIWFVGERNSLVNGKPEDSQILQSFASISTINGVSVENVYTFIIPVGDPGEKKICAKHGKTTLGIGLDNCENSAKISVTADTPKGTPVPVQSNEIGAPEGQICDPDPNDPKQACPENTKCTYQPMLDTTGVTGNYVCLREPDFSNALSFSSLTCAKLKGEKCIEVDTAIGPISTEPQGFVRSIFNVVLGLAGGIALILIIISGYKFMTSQGNPEAIKSATEGLTSAVIGLLFIIFAFVILQIIGVDILKIPGFE